VLHTASSAQTNTLSILTTALMFLGSSMTAMIYIGIISVIIMIYSFTVSYCQFLKIPVWKALLYGLLVFICSYIVQIILTTIFVFIYAMLTMHK